MLVFTKFSVIYESITRHYKHASEYYIMDMTFLVDLFRHCFLKGKLNFANCTIKKFRKYYCLMGTILLPDLKLHILRSLSQRGY